MSSFRMSRRQLILSAAAIALTASPKRSYASCEIDWAPKEYPFKLGVASGDPLQTSVVIWTRYAPSYCLERDYSGKAVLIRWEVADDESFRRIVRQGEVLASPEEGFAVHVEVEGLLPGREYFYRFYAGGHGSRIARTKTAPQYYPDVLGGYTNEELTFAFLSCSAFEETTGHAYAGVAGLHSAEKDKKDFVVHLGDYMYEKTYGDCKLGVASSKKIRCLDHREEVKSLFEYRRRYAEHKSDPMLQIAHEHAPWIVTWDDHEVENDYAALYSEANHKSDKAAIDEQEFLLRRARAYQAYFENMPLRAKARPNAGYMHLYRSFYFGRLLKLHVLDTRQYRSKWACVDSYGRKTEEAREVWAGKGVRTDKCAEFADPDRTMLGAEQESWLDAELKKSTALWNFIAQGVMFTPLDQRHHGEVREALAPTSERDGVLKTPSHIEQSYAYPDTWSGYPAAREKLLKQLQSTDAANPVILSGDIHAFFAGQNFSEDGKPLVPEFVTAGTSSWIGRNPQLKPAAASPCNSRAVKSFDLSGHGYSVCKLTPTEAKVNWYKYDHTQGMRLENPEHNVRSVAEFSVQSGSGALNVVSPSPEYTVDESLTGCDG